jgi:hypothetical protein
VCGVCVCVGRAEADVGLQHAELEAFKLKLLRLHAAVLIKDSIFGMSKRGPSDIVIKGPHDGLRAGVVVFNMKLRRMDSSGEICRTEGYEMALPVCFDKRGLQQKAIFGLDIPATTLPNEDHTLSIGHLVNDGDDAALEYDDCLQGACVHGVTHVVNLVVRAGGVPASDSDTVLRVCYGPTETYGTRDWYRSMESCKCPSCEEFRGDEKVEVLAGYDEDEDEDVDEGVDDEDDTKNAVEDQVISLLDGCYDQQGYHPNSMITYGDRVTGLVVAKDGIIAGWVDAVFKAKCDTAITINTIAVHWDHRSSVLGMDKSDDFDQRRGLGSECTHSTVSCRVLWCAVVCCGVVSCRVARCCVVSCRVLWCRVVPCQVVSWCVLCCVVLCCVVLCCVVLCCVVLCCVVLCCVVLWCGVVWCGVVWCGVVWCGVVWCGVVWRAVIVCV